MFDTEYFRKTQKAPPGVPKLVLFGFGKQRGQAEHVESLGESSANSANLVGLRDRLYYKGILGLAKDWDAMPEESLVDFDHWLVWVQAGSVVLGRILASSDLSNRKVYPFIVLAEVSNCPVAAVLWNLSPALNEFAQRCHKLPNLMEVKAAFASQQGALEGLVTAPSDAPVLAPSPDERRSFCVAAGLDAEGTAMAKILYKVESTWAPFVPARGGKAPKLQSGVALRVPAEANHLTASVLLWEEFVTTRVHPDVPRLYIVPAKHEWLDLVVGEFEGGHFRGLRLGLKQLGLETQVPYPISPELNAQARTIMDAWHTGKACPVADNPKAADPSASSRSNPPESLRPAPVASGGGRKIYWIVGLAVILVVGAVIVAKKRSGPVSPATKPESVAVPQPPPAQPPQVANLNLVHINANDQAQSVGLTVTVQSNQVSLAKLHWYTVVKPVGQLDVQPVFANGQWQLLIKPLVAGSAMVTVSAADERGLSGPPMSFPVTVEPKFEPPSVGLLQNQNLEEGQAASDMAIGVRVDSRLNRERANVKVTSEPAGVVAASTHFDDGLWHLNLAPQAAGTAQVTVVATDERGRASVPVSFEVNVYRPPVVEPVGPQILTEGKPATDVVLSVRLDQRLSLSKAAWDASSGPPGVVEARAEFTSHHWSLRLKPLAAGTATVKLTARDERGARSEQSTVKVTVTAAYAPPILSAVAPVTLTEGQASTSIPIQLSIDPRLRLDQAQVRATTDQPGVVKAVTRLEQGRWQLELTPQTAGAAVVTLAATIERGPASSPISLTVSVAGRPKGGPSGTATNIVVIADPRRSFEQLNEEVEVLAVRFNVIRPSSAKTEKGRAAQPINGQIDGAAMDAYLAEVDQLEQEFKAIGQVPPISLKKLRSQIRNFGF